MVPTLNLLLVTILFVLVFSCHPTPQNPRQKCAPEREQLLECCKNNTGSPCPIEFNLDQSDTTFSNVSLVNMPNSNNSRNCDAQHIAYQACLGNNITINFEERPNVEKRPKNQPQAVELAKQPAQQAAVFAVPILHNCSVFNTGPLLDKCCAEHASSAIGCPTTTTVSTTTEQTTYPPTTKFTGRPPIDPPIVYNCSVYCAGPALDACCAIRLPAIGCPTNATVTTTTVTPTKNHSSFVSSDNETSTIEDCHSEADEWKLLCCDSYFTKNEHIADGCKTLGESECYESSAGTVDLDCCEHLLMFHEPGCPPTCMFADGHVKRKCCETNPDYDGCP